MPLNEPPRDKTNKMTVRPAKTQISLGISPVWSESSLSAWRKLGSLATHWVHSKDSDQTGRMPRLIWVFAGRTVILLFLTWGGSNVSFNNKLTTSTLCILLSCDLCNFREYVLFSAFTKAPCFDTQNPAICNLAANVMWCHVMSRFAAYDMGLRCLSLFCSLDTSGLTNLYIIVPFKPHLYNG